MDRKYFHQLLIALDQVLNTLLAGYADETLSSRAWRSKDKRRWGIVVKVLNTFFFWQDNHCKAAFLSELNRNHFPDSLKVISKCAHEQNFN